MSSKKTKESPKNSKRASAQKIDVPNSADNSAEILDASVQTAADADADNTSDKNRAENATNYADTTDNMQNETASQDGEKNGGNKTSDPLAAYTMEELRDLYLRALADKENILRRAETEIKKARDFALDKFAPGICEVCDCLQVAINDTPAEGDKKNHEGIALALRKLSAVMEANGLFTINPDAGASFDTTLHQSIGVDSSGKYPANSVAAVIQPGYTLHGRIVRPANIIVSKPGEKQSPTA